MQEVELRLELQSRATQKAVAEAMQEQRGDMLKNFEKMIFVEY